MLDRFSGLLIPLANSVSAGRYAEGMIFGQKSRKSGCTGHVRGRLLQ